MPLSPYLRSTMNTNFEILRILTLYQTFNMIIPLPHLTFSRKRQIIRSLLLLSNFLSRYLLNTTQYSTKTVLIIIQYYSFSQLFRSRDTIQKITLTKTCVLEEIRLGTIYIISCGKVAFPILIKEALCCYSRCSSRFTIMFIKTILASISNKTIKTLIQFYFFARVGVLLVKAFYQVLTFRGIEKRVLIAT